MVLLSKPLASLVALLPLITGVFASPAAEPVRYEERQTGFFAVTGVTGGVASRLELSQLQSSNPTQWNLFLIALQRFQSKNQNERLSYFQICGIHGAPFVAWDGVVATSNSQSGYCTHSSNLFGPWHRPYLALFEQALNINANEFVNTIPAGATRDAWAAAARTLRLPYLDWARPLASGQQILPPSLTTSTIAVRYPDGTTRNIANPLYEYRFNPGPTTDFGSPWNRWRRTVRSPANSQDTNSPSNNAAVNANLLRMRSNIRQYVYNILTQSQTFNQFSNTGSEASLFGTLEGIHDSIHSTISGHMGIVNVAAFDPIFWMHHCNIDRLQALFQYLNPNTYVTPFAQRRSTYTIRAGSVQDANSPLTPFHSNTAGAFWSSNSARQTTSLGYRYPELADNPSAATLRTRINNLYRPSATTLVARGVPALDASDAALDRRAPTPRTYLLSIQAPAAIGGTYDINVFFGPPSAEPSNYKLDPNFVGVQGLLAKLGATNTEPVQGTIPLTSALESRRASGALKADSHRAVLAYLRENLRWRVQKDGAEVPPEQVPGLKVTVISAVVRPAKTESDFPVWEKLVEHPQVTEGKNGL